MNLKNNLQKKPTTKKNEGRATTHILHLLSCESPKLKTRIDYAITIRPYYTKERNWKNVMSSQNVNLHIYENINFSQNGQNEKGENASCDHFLPLRMGGSDFGLKTGSRGTPWNSKNAGPGGSDFTKCHFWPFIWHFGVFEGGSIFDTFFIIFHFSVLSLFDDFDFLSFVTFRVFVFFHFFLFLCFDDFCHFLTLFCCWHQFWSIFVSKLGASIMTHFSPSIPVLPLSPLLVVKLWPIFVL